MKKAILFFCLLLLSIGAFAQAPTAGELIQIHSVTTAEMTAITSPVTGSVVYNTDDNMMELIG